jgi:hypothetical protein
MGLQAFNWSAPSGTRDRIAHARYPLMTNLHNLNVLVVDRFDYTGCALRDAFIKAGANTHVVGSLAAAHLLLETKHLDAVIVEFSTDPETVQFCKTLSELSLPCIFTYEPPYRYDDARKKGGKLVDAIRKVLENSVQMTPVGFDDVRPLKRQG